MTAPRTSPSHVPVVECRNLWKIYDAPDRHSEQRIVADRLSRADAMERFGALVAVRDVSFAIEEGEIFCIMGLSGSGKSTVLRHINRLIDPTVGFVRIAGTDIVEKSPAQLRLLRSRTIGMVSQHMSLFPHRTVRHNVGYALKPRGVAIAERNRVADEKLALVQLSGWGDSYPHQLSGGMQQRVGLARALASDPRILLMDEPFSALDPLIRRQLQDEFKRIWRTMRKSVLFITHDLEEALHLGDRIAIMRDGEFVQVGRPEDIALAPANAYVAEFIRGASKVRFMTALRVMVPLSQAEAMESDYVGRFRHDTAVLDLVEPCLADDRPALIVDGEEKPIGCVTRQVLLKALSIDRSGA